MPRRRYTSADIARVTILFSVLFVWMIRCSGDRKSVAPPMITSLPKDTVVPVVEAVVEDTIAIARRLIVAFDTASLSYDLWMKVNDIRSYGLGSDNDFFLRYDSQTPQYYDSARTVVRESITSTENFLSMLRAVEVVLQDLLIQEIVFVGAPMLLPDTTVSLGPVLHQLVNFPSRTGVIPQVHVVYHDEQDERTSIVKDFIRLLLLVTDHDNIAEHPIRQRIEGS